MMMVSITSSFLSIFSVYPLFVLIVLSFPSNYSPLISIDAAASPLFSVKKVQNLTFHETRDLISSANDAAAAADDDNGHEKSGGRLGFLKTKTPNNNFDNLQEYFQHLEQQQDDFEKQRKTTTKFPGSRRTTSRRPSGRPSGRPSSSSRRPQQTRSTITPTPPLSSSRRTTTRRSTTTTAKRTTTTTPQMTTEEMPSAELGPIDFTWIMICAFIIFTMQTGFGLLEGGIVSQKNETNIMLKNVSDVVLGGFTYWIFGYGITFGTWKGSTPYFGIGDYAVDSSTVGPMGDLFTSFVFQLSFATTSTTIVSGAMAERCNFKAYCLYSLLATITYCVQARWVWGPTGWLGALGVIDIAGSGSVHLVGGVSALVAAWLLGPRLGRYEGDGEAPPPGNPTNVILGTFNLWWGWMSFNAGSTYGVTGDKWKFSARAASTTIIASIGGGMIGLLWGFLRPGKPFGVLDVANSVLGSLVAITAGCALFHTPEAFITGCIGALVALVTAYIPDFFHIDDPVGAMAVHGFAGAWGMLSVGFFAESDQDILGVTKGNAGLFRGGSAYLLGVQALAVVSVAAWSAISTLIILLLIKIIVPLRVPAHEELMGLDFCEHGIHRRNIGIGPALSVFGSLPEVHEKIKLAGITGGDNPAHHQITESLRDVRRTKLKRAKKRESLDSSGGSDTKTTRKRIRSSLVFARAFKKLEAKGMQGNRINPRDRQYIFQEELYKYKNPLKSSTETLYPSDCPREGGMKGLSKNFFLLKFGKNKKLDPPPSQEDRSDGRNFQWSRKERERIQITRESSVENLQEEKKFDCPKTKIEKADDKYTQTENKKVTIVEKNENIEKIIDDTKKVDAIVVSSKDQNKCGHFTD